MSSIARQCATQQQFISATTKVKLTQAFLEFQLSVVFNYKCSHFYEIKFSYSLNLELETSFLQLRIHPEQASWCCLHGCRHKLQGLFLLELSNDGESVSLHRMYLGKCLIGSGIFDAFMIALRSAIFYYYFLY